MYTIFIDRYESNGTSESHALKSVALLSLFKYLKDDGAEIMTVADLENQLASDDPTKGCDSDVKAIGMYDNDVVYPDYCFRHIDKSNGPFNVVGTKFCCGLEQVDILTREFVAECMLKQPGCREVIPEDLNADDINAFLKKHGDKYSWEYWKIDNNLQRIES